MVVRVRFFASLADRTGCSSETVGDLTQEVADLIHGGYCKQAADCAAAVNEGEALVDGTGTDTTSETGGAATPTRPILPERPGIESIRGVFLPWITPATWSRDEDDPGTRSAAPRRGTRSAEDPRRGREDRSP